MATAWKISVMIGGNIKTEFKEEGWEIGVLN